MNALIIEDEELSAKHLAHLCAKLPEIDQIEVSQTALEGLKVIEAKPVDLIFLDIEMPDMSGMELLRNFKDIPPVILTTSRKEFAVESYEYNVLDYLLKPVDFARLVKAVKKLPNKEENKTSRSDEPKSSDKIFIRSNGKHVQIDRTSILYIETMDDYLKIFLENGQKHLVHATLRKMESKLEPDYFFRVHRSYLINLNKLDSIEDTHLEIKGKVIPISRSKRPLLMERIQTL
jgi:DNA-binding LytR/AlgR family response regulator